MADINSTFTPFEEKLSRKETFLVCFDNVLCNVNYLICRYILDNITEYQDKYPLAKILFNRTEEELFVFGSGISRKDLLPFLSGDDNNRDFLKEYREIENKIDFIKYGELCYSIAVALVGLSESESVSRIFIYSDNMTDNKISYVTRMFGVDICNSKVFTVETTCIDFLSQFNSEITTIFIHDIESIFDDYVNNDVFDKKEKVIYIMYSPVNVDGGINGNLKHYEIIPELIKKWIFEIRFYAGSFKYIY